MIFSFIHIFVKNEEFSFEKEKISQCDIFYNNCSNCSLQTGCEK